MTPKIYRRYVVRVSENALISLVLSSLEAYSVKKKDIKEKGRPKSRIEVYGSLFGHEVIMKIRKSSTRWRWHTQIQLPSREEVP